MILAAARPNYLPDIAWFHKWAFADCFLLADDIIYSPKSDVNRARIKTAQGTQWLTVPVLKKGKGPQTIKDLKIDNLRNWRQKHWKTLLTNYRPTPFFEYYEDFFETIYAKEASFLIDFNTEILHYLQKALKIEHPFLLTSKVGIARKNTPSARIVAIANKMNCDTYLANPGDEVFLEKAVFDAANINLQFQKFSPPVYTQVFAGFLPNLSVIDLLFNTGPDAKRLLLA